MPEQDFAGLALVAGVAFLAPLLLSLAPALRVPAVALEIVAGIVIGPSGFGWVMIDPVLTVLSTLGLAFLLFLAGAEIDIKGLRGRVLRLAGLAFGLSLALALVAGFGLNAAGAADAPLLIAVILSATGLGVIAPVLKDSGQAGSRFGQVVIAAGSIAEFAPIILLALLFSMESTGLGSRVILLGGFLLVVVLVGLVLFGVTRTMRLTPALRRLQDTTAQIRVRGAFLLLACFLFLSGLLGLEVIIGAFLAGQLLTLIDKDTMTHPEFRIKLEGAGFGVFVPFFFVTSGIRFDLSALFAGPSALARVPLFLLAMLVVRTMPALLYRRLLGGRGALAAGLLQATSLTFIVAGTTIGHELGLISPATSAAFVAAGLLSVLIFPLVAVMLLQSSHGDEEVSAAPDPFEQRVTGPAV